MHKLTIDPVTRIEGHLKIDVEIDGGKVVNAFSSGTMFRGMEIILKGRDPRDALHLTQRICGVCPASHGLASSLAVDDAFGVVPPKNGRIMRNLVLSANYLQSHILHFYHLAALDYVKGPDVSPFIPRYNGDYRLSDKENERCVKHYLKGLEIRRKAQEALSLFGGKMPCHITFCPGGITEVPTVDKIAKFSWYIKEIIKFIDDAYLPDVVSVAKAYSDYAEIGKGPCNLLSYGVFSLNGEKKLLYSGVYINGKAGEFDQEKIKEEVKYSYYKPTEPLHPSSGKTEPDLGRKDAYSFLKSPRYEGNVVEVGPLARMGISYLGEEKRVKELVDNLLSLLNISFTNLFSVIGRHGARALEARFIAESMEGWLKELDPKEPTTTDYEIPNEGEGMGITEAPRGALGHWLRIEDKRIANYQVITPTNWNASCMDSKNQPGPIEQALIGTKVKDIENPIEILRVVRSFDPCLACSVHIITPKKELKFRVM